MTTRRYFGEGNDGDIIGTRPRPTADLGPLFAASLAVHEATEAGIQAAHDSANKRWQQVAYAAIVAVARREPTFTADAVWAELQGATPATHALSALGPLFRIAADRGLIRKSGRHLPTTQAQRHRDLVEWRSCITDHPPQPGLR